MLQNMLPPLFQIFTGLGFLALLLVGTRARAALTRPGGRLAAFALIPSTLAMFILSRATGAFSLGAASEMFLAAGISILVSVVLLAAALFLSARSIA